MSVAEYPPWPNSNLLKNGCLYIIKKKIKQISLMLEVGGKINIFMNEHFACTCQGWDFALEQVKFCLKYH